MDNMNIRKLKAVLESMAVPHRWYSINDGLKVDALVLYENYRYWEFFYYSEKGDRLDHKIFETEHEACLYFLDKIRFQLDLLKR
jgi:hypothetical protein